MAHVPCAAEKWHISKAWRCGVPKVACAFLTSARTQRARPRFPTIAPVPHSHLASTLPQPRRSRAAGRPRFPDASDSGSRSRRRWYFTGRGRGCRAGCEVVEYRRHLRVKSQALHFCRQPCRNFSRSEVAGITDSTPAGKTEGCCPR